MAQFVTRGRPIRGIVRRIGHWRQPAITSGSRSLPQKFRVGGLIVILLNCVDDIAVIDLVGKNPEFETSDLTNLGLDLLDFFAGHVDALLAAAGNAFHVFLDVLEFFGMKVLVNKCFNVRSFWPVACSTVFEVVP